MLRISDKRLILRLPLNRLDSFKILMLCEFGIVYIHCTYFTKLNNTIVFQSLGLRKSFENFAIGNWGIKIKIKLLKPPSRADKSQKTVKKI